MHHGDRRGREEFYEEVPVAHGVEAVFRDAREPEGIRGVSHVEVVRASGQGPGPERGYVKSREAVKEPPRVSLEHLVVGEEGVAQEHGLRPLKVRVARKNAPEVLIRGLHNGLPEAMKKRRYLEYLILEK